jgi:hypothetical protein
VYINGWNLVLKIEVGLLNIEDILPAEIPEFFVGRCTTMNGCVSLYARALHRLGRKNLSMSSTNDRWM